MEKLEILQQVEEAEVDLEKMYHYFQILILFLQPYQRTDPKSDEYFNAPERKGGPTDPLTGFEQVFELLFKGDKNYKYYNEYPIYKYLAQFSSKPNKVASSTPGKEGTKQEADIQANGKQSEEEKDPQEAGSQKQWMRNYDNLSEKDRSEMLVDEIFALYLYRISQKVNEVFYKTVLTYGILFRECLNEIGWSKKIESE